MTAFFVLLLASIPVALVAHEAGHAAAARLLGYPVSFVLSRRGIGTRIQFGPDPDGDLATVDQRDLLLTVLAGPLASFAFAVAVWALGAPVFAATSVELGLLNLLPFPHSDGRRAIATALRIASRGRNRDGSTLAPFPTKGGTS